MRPPRARGEGWRRRASRAPFVTDKESHQCHRVIAIPSVA
jgi:hypothetical protein